MKDFGNIKDLKTVYVVVDLNGVIQGSPFYFKDTAEAFMRCIKTPCRIVEMSVTPQEQPQ